MTWLRSAGLALIAGMILTAGFHAGVGDVLLFKSDPASFARYFFAAASLVGLAVLVLFGLPAAVMPRWRRILRLAAITLLVTFMVLGFIGSLVWGVTHWFHLGLLLGQIFDLEQVHKLKVFIIAILPVIGGGGLFVVLLIVARVVRNDPSVSDRVENLGLASIVFGILSTAASFVPPPGAVAVGDGRNVVMIVVDRFPAWALRAYDSNRQTAAFDDVAAVAMVAEPLLSLVLHHPTIQRLTRCGSMM